MKRTIIALTTLAGLGAIAALWPPRRMQLTSRPDPACCYAEAIERFATVQLRDTPAVNPLCYSQLLDHGRRTQLAVVLLHGLTNCPHQFHELGRLLHARGHTVLIPRMTYQGLADRMNRLQARLRAEDMVMVAEEALDIARGLGEHVVVAGISQGGTAAAWLAQQRPDLDRAVLIAPLLGILMVQRALTVPMRNLLLRLPNLFIWWDSKARNSMTGPQHAYPRFPTRAIGESLLLATTVQQAARHGPPAAGSIAVITSAADLAVDNRFTRALVHTWQQQRPGSVTTYEFPSALNILHDMVDPHQVAQRTDLVYPVITRLIEQL